jgi:hypothetical protein
MTRNADRIPIAAWRAKVATVEQMAAAKWLVIAECSTCRLKLKVDLFRVASERGPQTVLWDRSQPCKALGCRGSVSFAARVPGRSDWQPLISADLPKPMTEGERAQKTPGPGG